MESGVLSAASRPEPSQVAFSRNGHPPTLEELTATWTCKKRDGSTVAFSPEKIRAALRKCFLSLTPGVEPAPATEKIVQAIVNVLMARKITCSDIEDVQRLVIQQLWSEGLFEAAEHYQNFREQRRVAREQRPIPADVAARVHEDQKHFANDLQYYQFMGKFSRWREQEKRRETWKEACFDRIMPWFQKLPHVQGKVTAEEWNMLGQAMYNLEASPAMRVVQMAGPALDRCHVGVYNCAYQPIQDLFSLPEMLYILMQGSGAGFSVETDYVSEMPRVKKQRGLKADTIVVGDSTESWCDSYHQLLQRLFDGHDAWMEVSGVRKRGTRLLTKGGRASGPEPFLELVCFARNIIKARQGRIMEDTDWHRLACFTGRIVQMGGVRRASEISLSDLASVGMRNLKTGAWYADKTHWTDGRYLSMANNSAVYSSRPSSEEFMREWLALVESKAGERGIFNREAALLHRPHRRLAARFGCNPCAEIILRPHQFCNLSIVVARADDTYETLRKKTIIATIFGVMQSTCTDFKYVRPDWKKNCEEERLIGVDITGHADCPLLQNGAPGREQLLQRLAQVVHVTKKIYAERFGINESAADTCIKPSGDSAVFFDCGSGISDRFADYQVRWVREDKDSPVAKFLLASGVPHAPAPENPDSLLVFGFPREAPKGATTRNKHTAIQQCEMWLQTKKAWAEHSVSATIYVDEHEWFDVGAWVYRQENWDHITGLSFLPKDNGTYTYAPNEELAFADYLDFKGKFPKLNWAKLPQFEPEDMTTAAQTLACTSGSCEM